MSSELKEPKREFKYEEEQNKYENNPLASVLHEVAGIIKGIGCVIGVIGMIVFIASEGNILGGIGFAILMTLAGLVSSLALYIPAEIIYLLQDIDDKIKK